MFNLNPWGFKGSSLFKVVIYSMLNITVTMINLEIVKKFIIDREILLNLVEFKVKDQFDSLMFINKVEIVIRIYMKIIRIVKIIMTVGRRIMFLYKRAWIVSHFGMNPRKGGIPLRDKKFMIKNNFVMIL